MSNISSVLKTACAGQDPEQHRGNYLAQDEFVVVEDFVPPEVRQQWDLQFGQLRPHIHRNFIPRHKKGGSVARFDFKGVFFKRSRPTPGSPADL
mgnify:CR=1 FL=1